MSSSTGSAGRITLLGGFDFQINGNKIEFATRHATSLFAFLLLNVGRKISRDRLVGLFWPDQEEIRARRNLSTTLWRIRKELRACPAIALELTRDRVKLEVGETEVDLYAFRALVQRGAATSGNPRLDCLREAEALYAGDLLEGFSDEWCEAARRETSEQYLGLLRDLADAFRERAEHEKAVECLTKLVERDPLDEDSHRRLMLAYHLSGNRSAAIAQFERLRQILSSELGVEPSAQTTELHEHIRSQYGRMPEDSDISAPGLRSPRTTRVLGDVPLVGRNAELGVLVDSIEQVAKGRGKAAVVTGDTGIGKTRLVGAAVAEGRLRGFDVFTGECPDLESPPPYQVIIQALWPKIAAHPRTPSTTISVVDTLIDTLSGTPAHEKDSGSASSLVNTAFLNEALLSLLGGDTTPTLLVLEDVHRADHATKTLLLTLLSRLSKLKIFVLITVRLGDSHSEEILAELVSSGVEVLRVEPLSEASVGELLGSALGMRRVPRSLLEFVWERTAGMPLFVIELLDFLIASGCLIPAGNGSFALDVRVSLEHLEIPSRVLEIIQGRIRLLEPVAREVLCTAAILGSEIPFADLEQMIGKAEDQFLEGVEQLLTERLLVETPKAVRFPHQSVRNAALGSLSRARLRALHKKAARLLEKIAPGRTSELAWHYREAGEKPHALRYYEMAGDKAKSVHANGDAIRWYAEALEIAEGLAQEPESLRKKAALLLKRQEVLDLWGDRPGQSRDIEAVLAIASELKDPLLKAHGELLRSQVLSRMNRSTEALEVARRSEAVFSLVGDVSHSAQAWESVGLAYVNLRNQVEAKRAFRKALLMYRRIGERAGEARVLVNLGIVFSHDGRNLDAMRCLGDAEKILRQLGDKRSLAVALLQQGVLFRYLGQQSRSEAFLTDGISILKEIGDKTGEARGLSQLAYTHMASGKMRLSLHESLKAIRLARQAQDRRAEIILMNNAAYAALRCVGDFNRSRGLVQESMRLVAESGSSENSAIYSDTMAAIAMDEGDFEAALSWAQQAKALFRTWEGHYSAVGVDIDYRLGAAYLYLNKHALAYPLLMRAAQIWEKWDDLGLQAHGVAALGQLYLDQGKTQEALECARRIEKLLRRVDGLEQIQKVHWAQYRIFRQVGAHAAARKALKRAYQAIMEQASTLKGRFRRRFLEAVMVNREVLEEIRRLSESRATSEEQSPDLATGTRPQSFLPPGTRVEARRRRLLTLLGNGPFRQKDVAARLGVSLRTIRNDLVTLRRQGLLPQQ